MKVLMISFDRGVFQEGSIARERALLYSKAVQLHIIVFAKKQLGLTKVEVSSTLTVYPTNSMSRWFYISDAIKIARRELSDIPDIDVITAQDPFEAGLVAWRLSRRFKKKFQLQVHTDFLSPHFSYSLLQKVRVRIARFLLPQADSIRVVSGRIKESLKHVSLKVSPEILPVYIDISAFATMVPQFDLHKKYRQFSFIILMATRLSPEKDIGVALEALRRVVCHYPKLGLVVLGEGGERQHLLHLAKQKGIEDHVVFEPWQHDVASSYKTADLFLLTSRFEGFAATLAEAVAAGCPVVSTDVGIAPLLYPLRKDLYVCPVGDAGCIAQKILYQLNNPTFRDDFAINAKHFLAQNIISDKHLYLERHMSMWRQLVV